MFEVRLEASTPLSNYKHLVIRPFAFILKILMWIIYLALNKFFENFKNFVSELLLNLSRNLENLKNPIVNFSY